MCHLCYLCLFGSSLPPVVSRRTHVLFMLFVDSYNKKLEVKTNRTNTNNINET
jgi:hypothetical protein